MLGSQPSGRLLQKTTLSLERAFCLPDPLKTTSAVPLIGKVYNMHLKRPAKDAEFPVILLLFLKAIHKCSNSPNWLSWSFNQLCRSGF